MINGDFSRNENTVSVVIASAAGGKFLLDCLDAVLNQSRSAPLEVIVVDRCGPERVAQLKKAYPSIQVIAAPGKGCSVPELRRMGVEQASGKIIAIIEEHCLVPNHWIEAIQNNFLEGDAAIGGPILDHGYTRVQDWVVYFSEYHNYMPPWIGGKRFLLNGANIAYDRQKLNRHLELLGQGYWEIVLHPVLAKEGAFRAVPSMGAHHSGPFEYGYYLRQRFLLSRVWGGGQRMKTSLKQRLIHLAAAPIFPAFFLGRIAKKVFQSKQYLGKFVTTLPLLVPVALAYTWGEWLGYLFGIGNALEQVE